MPLFRLNKDAVQAIPQASFPSEKALQFLVEHNLGVIFNCRLVASEFPTGAQHGGRIDTLALSEDNNPVIIEYKKVESSELINQSLFYLAWLNDHRGDFQVAAQKALGPKTAIDWSDVRVICIAPTYRKYDLHAVQVMGRSIELWSYRRYSNDMLLLEEVLQGPAMAASSSAGGKNPVMVAAGKKAALTRANALWTFARHVDGKPPQIRDLAHLVQEFMLGIDPAIEEAPKKQYVAYRIAQNIVSMEVQRQKIYLYVKLDPKLDLGLKGISRDVTNVGHFGTGNLEITVKSAADLERAKPALRRAYELVGG
jgi:predicted transport protein